MEKWNKRVVHYNAQLVEELFRIMFDTLWVAPMLRFESDAAFREFECMGRNVAALLCANDFAYADDECRARLRTACRALRKSVEMLSAHQLVPEQKANEALALVLRITRLGEKGRIRCAVETRNK